MALNKEGLIDRLYHKIAAAKTIYPKWELQGIIDPFIEVLNEALSEGNEVRLKNLGKFVIKTKKGRKFYNIQKGTMNFTPKTKLVVFIAHRNINPPSKVE